MSNETAAQLRALKLHGMAQTWPELLAQARHNDFAPEAFMQALLKAEIAERAVRSINYQMTAARFPAHRDIANFDFSQSNLDENLVRELHTIKFCESGIAQPSSDS